VGRLVELGVDMQVLSTKRGGKLLSWDVGRLWELSEGLPQRAVPVAALEHMLDEVCWFDDGSGGEHPPSCRAVAEHSERIYSADLGEPILLSATGDVMDGMHRLAKAWMLGHETILAKQFEIDPDPDWVE